jgi:hypothetical protein
MKGVSFVRQLFFFLKYALKNELYFKCQDGRQVATKGYNSSRRTSEEAYNTPTTIDTTIATCLAQPPSKDGEEMPQKDIRPELSRSN